MEKESILSDTDFLRVLLHQQTKNEQMVSWAEGFSLLTSPQVSGHIFPFRSVLWSRLVNCSC